MARANNKIRVQLEAGLRMVKGGMSMSCIINSSH